MARIVTLVIFLLMLIAGLFFGLLNADPVSINYYWGQGAIPLSLLMAMMLIFGALLGVLASLGMVIRLRHQLGRQKRQLRDREKELSNLRAIPLKNDR